MDQDTALDIVREQDIRRRMEGGASMVQYLSRDAEDMNWTNIDKIVDALGTQWVSSSNFKVALLGLDILNLLLGCIQKEFHHYYHLIQVPLLDRLGDQKDQVRDASITLLTNIMQASSTPQEIFEQLGGAFTHKVWRVRESVCRLLVATINRFGSKSLYLSRLLPRVCKLIMDSNAQVRNTAEFTLSEIYRHVGEKVRQDVSKNEELSSQKKNSLFHRFDQIRDAGEMNTGENKDVMMRSSSMTSHDSCDDISVNSAKSHNFIPRCSTTATTVSRSNNHHLPPSSRTASVEVSSRPVTTALPSRRTTTTRNVKSSIAGIRSNAGGLDDESFQNDFTTNLPTVRIFSARDVVDMMQSINTVIADDRKDWEIRTKSLKQLRAMIVAGGTEYDTFYQELRAMEPALMHNAKDLRSQVVRETCVTVGFLSFTLKNQFEHCARTLLPALFTLIPNSAKIMSTSGILAIRTILKHTQHTRMIPLVLDHSSSKSTAIRKHTFCFLVIILQNWSLNLLEKHILALQKSITKGISDADAESREESRNAWHGFSQLFPNEADEIYNKLSSNQQKHMKEYIPASSSSDSLKQSDNNSKSKRTSIPSKTAAGTRRHGPSRVKSTTSTTSSYAFNRSRSDVDSSSVLRSKAKANSRSGYNTIGRTSKPNLPIPTTSSTSSMTSSNRGATQPRRVAAIPTPARRSRTMEIDSSIPSHPGSRSTSPNGHVRRTRVTSSNIAPHPASSRTPYRTPLKSSNSTGGDHTTTTPSRIPVSRSRIGSRINSLTGTPVHSRGTSRTTSPTRYRGRTSMSSTTPMRVLPKGKEGEQALSNALLRKNRGRGGAAGEFSDLDDDYSDTSSVCSDRSYTRMGMKKRNHHHYNHGNDDVSKVLDSCESTSWTERKEGLSNLHSLILQQSHFSPLQLKKILEIFNKMFADPHGKVFSMFLEMLPEFVMNYKLQLEDWLYCLMTQLLKKMGADLLGSVQNKVLNALRVTRESFPPPLQFTILCRYMVDQAQRPNLKVRVALLHYLLDLSRLMKSEDLINTPETRMAISKIITWTTEPKSADVRRVAEALLISLFELNVVSFIAVIQNVPKTFKEGAMKILHGCMESIPEYQQQQQVSSTSTNHQTTTSNDISHSPSSLLHSSMDNTLIQNETVVPSMVNDLREITTSIEKLQTPSKSLFHENESEKLDDSTPTFRCLTPSSGMGYNSPRQQMTKYSPSTYASSAENKKLFSPVTSNDDTPRKTAMETNLVDKMARNLSVNDDDMDESQKQEQLNQFLHAIKTPGHVKVYRDQWQYHFRSILYGLLEILRTNQQTDTVIAALAILKEMITLFSKDQLSDHIEITFTHLINCQNKENREIVRETDSTLNCLISSVDPILIIKILIPILESKEPESDMKEICLIKLDTVLRRCTKGTLNTHIVDNIMPSILECFHSNKSNTRKISCFCLVTLHRIIGNDELSPRIQSLAPGKLKLLQLYITKQQSG